MSAALIAACATNSMSSTPSPYEVVTYSEKRRTYYLVEFRLYYHFNSTFIVQSVNGMLNPVRVPGTTMGVSHIFSVDSKKCVDGIEKYIEDNRERFENSKVWETRKEEMISKYVKQLEKTYNIKIVESNLDITPQYCWHLVV